MDSSTERPRRIVLAVSASIAAYRAADLASELVKQGHEVQCLLTRGAREFVTPLVLETLSRRPALDALWGPGVSGTEHIRIARWADLMVFAPATAHLIARLSLGLADDLVTTVALATEAPWLIAPAMNTVMWRNPATQGHVRALRESGARFVDPDSGDLACGEAGEGRLARPERILAEILGQPEPGAQDLRGVRVLITAGPTISRIDAVRYMTNGSTGKMGAALAEEALRRGAEVRYVLGIDKGVVRPVAPAGAAGRLSVTEVRTAEEMADASLSELPRVDGVIATAAVLDYKVERPAAGKQKRATEPVSLGLVPSIDVLATLRTRARAGQWFVGFAAESDDVEANARRKLEAKRLDLVFVNRVEAAFGTETNEGILLGADGFRTELRRGPKTLIARAIWDAIRDRRAVHATP